MGNYGFLVLRNFSRMNCIQKLTQVDADTVPRTLTVVCFLSTFQPRWQGKVDGFGNVEACIKSLVVSSSSGNNKFPCALDSSSHLDSLRKQVISVDERGLVPYVFWAELKLLAKMAPDVRLKRLVVVEIHRVPELGLAKVEVVDAVEVAVFFVPAKHGFPRAHVEVRGCNPLYGLLVEALAINTRENQGESWAYLRRVFISARFHATPLSKIEPELSAP